MKQFPHTFMLPRFAILLGRFQGRNSNRLTILFIALLVVLLAVNTASAADTEDPFSGINRPVHKFNSVMDSILFRPLAQTYDRFTPRIVKRGISNVLGNLDDVVVTANDLLQFKFRQAGSDLSRVAINSTLGVGGLIDVAGNIFELDKHDENFGQTLAHWGVERGPYLVLPLLGPSTVREGVSRVADSLVNPGLGSADSTVRGQVVSANVLDSRAALLNLDELVIGDDYLFMRELYLQNLEYREADGNLLVTFEEF